MRKIAIQDLREDRTLDQTSMAEIHGGHVNLPMQLSPAENPGGVIDSAGDTELKMIRNPGTWLRIM